MLVLMRKGRDGTIHDVSVHTDMAKLKDYVAFMVYHGYLVKDFFYYNVSSNLPYAIV